MKTTLIINGHPNKESFCTALAENYYAGAQTRNNNSRIVHLTDINFSTNLAHGYQKRTDLEPDLVNLQQALLDANHLVFVYPNWWGTYPALFKGFIDRVFLPGITFKPRPDSLFWDKLLKGKSARIIVTMDTPKWYYWLIYKSPGHNSMKKSILGFCGVKPIRTTVFTPVKTSSEKKRNKWLLQVFELGTKLN